MKMFGRNKTVLILGLVGLLAKLSGQQIDVPEVIPQATLNISKLETRITLDHDVYVPGEVIRVTVAIRNPTSQSLEIPKPFWPQRAGFDVLEKDSPRGRELGIEYSYMGPHPYADYRPWSPETILIQQYDVMTATVGSDEAVFTESPILVRMGAPTHPGQYRIAYSYDPRSYVDFKVEQPVLERFISIRSKERRLKDDHSASDRCFCWTNAFAVTLGEEHLVFRTIFPEHRSYTPNTAVGGQWLLEDTLGQAPYERIGESKEPITGLTLSPGSDPGKILIRWSDAFGKASEVERNIDHASSARPIPAK